MKPIHPVLVHFPIALLVVSVGADAIGMLAAIPSLSHTGWWTMLAAAGGAVVTAAAGVFDMRRATLSEDVHHRVHRHMKVGIVLVIAILGLAFWRWRMQVAGGPVSMYYIDAGLLAVALAGVQGYLGGELVYTDGVFVRPVSKSGDAKADVSGPSHPH